ncbi:class I SAM-dependent methyltransferase [Motilibacter aurantiacus]|uniref:class I SAM-dependent methyltransferase n=1 Tax=Motilibacter aurantiacus TaxID=2714955 RepID=UPI00140D4BAF|nr:class I SAM-dependent methyltransferase [Motilibacter aurantiacus]NHC43762.1 class I SAM-dependent methyltransferase [Motilibacter aurantiacus]
MSRWDDIRGDRTGADYAARFDALSASGADVHGEAALCARLAGPGARVLDAGCGTGRVAIRLAELGYAVVGVDLDPGMLAVARARAPHIPWVESDLAALDLGPADGTPFDLVVAAGNVVSLVAPGTEAVVVSAMAGRLRPAGLLVAGFGLDPAHLPLDEPTVSLAQYDAWCAGAGLTLEDRFATWDGQAYAGGGYAVSVHRRAG